MSDEYAGDDLTGLSEALGEVYDELAGVEETPSALLVPDAIANEWTVGRMVSTMIPLLIALAVLQMVSGSVLERFEEVLLVNPALLVLVPVQIGTAGTLGSIMCSRLSTELHLGTFELSPHNPGVRANIGAVVGLGMTVFSLVGVAAWGIGQALGGQLGLGSVLIISLASGLLLTAFVVVLSLGAVTLSYRLGYNPDDTTIPVVTNVADITGVLILFTVVSIVL